MRNAPMIIKVMVVAASFVLMVLLLSTPASAKVGNSAKVDDGFVLLAKDGRAGAGAENAADASSAQRGADSDEGDTFSLNICFAPALVYGNILMLAPFRTFTFCLQGPRQVSSPNRGGLPVRESTPIEWLLSPVREFAGGK